MNMVLCRDVLRHAAVRVQLPRTAISVSPTSSCTATLSSIPRIRSLSALSIWQICSQSSFHISNTSNPNSSNHLSPHSSCYRLSPTGSRPHRSEKGLKSCCNVSCVSYIRCVCLLKECGRGDGSWKGRHECLRLQIETSHGRLEV